jgi:hypothetical protein
VNKRNERHSYHLGMEISPETEIICGQIIIIIDREKIEDVFAVLNINKQDMNPIKLVEIQKKYPGQLLTVIAETSSHGDIYQYSNYPGESKWRLHGITKGYA